MGLNQLQDSLQGGKRTFLQDGEGELDLSGCAGGLFTRVSVEKQIALRECDPEDLLRLQLVGDSVELLLIGAPVELCGVDQLLDPLLAQSRECCRAISCSA